MSFWMFCLAWVLGGWVGDEKGHVLYIGSCVRMCAFERASEGMCRLQEWKVCFGRVVEGGVDSVRRGSRRVHSSGDKHDAEWLVSYFPTRERFEMQILASLGRYLSGGILGLRYVFLCLPYDLQSSLFVVWLGPAAYEKRCGYECCLEPDEWCHWDAASCKYRLSGSKHSCANRWMLVKEFGYVLLCGE